MNLVIRTNQIKEKIIEVETSLNLNPTKDDIEKINTNIIFSTIIELDEKISNKVELEKIILIKVPSEIYSEIRQSFVFLFEKSGFKDVKIDKVVNFEKLYLERKN